MTPQSIGPYRVLAQVGRGGMGSVYRAQDRAGRDVAIKVMVASSGPSVARRKRFGREAAALERLRHSNIVEVFATGEHQGWPYLVMAFVEGEDLGARIARGGPLASCDAAEVGYRLATALVHAHEQGVLHRDLKPDNVLLTHDGSPLLTDFGLAQDLLADESRLTQTGTLMGTPGFWSPEQATGQVAQVDERTDVYGLGALLYATLTGFPPHHAATAVEAAVSALDKAPVRPSRHRADVDPTLERIVLRCLEKDPAKRYPSAAALADALARYQGGERRRTPLWPVAVGATLLCVGGVAFGVASSAETSAPDTAVPVSSPSTSTPPAPSPEPPVEESSPTPPALPSVDPNSPELKALVLEARAAMQRRDWILAIELNTQVLAMNPAHAGALNDRGFARGQLKQTRAAIDDFTRAIELRPDAVGPLANRGSHLMELGDYHAAISDLDRAIQIQPQAPHALRNRGLCRERLGDRRGAVADYTRVVEIDPRDSMTWSGLGVLRFELGDRQGGLEDLDRAIALNPTFTDCIRNRGLFHKLMGNHPRAIADFTRVLELSPDRADVHEHRADVLRAAGNSAGAIADYDRALSLDAKRPRALANRGWVYAQGGQHQEALADYDAALGLYPAGHREVKVVREWRRAAQAAVESLPR